MLTTEKYTYETISWQNILKMQCLLVFTQCQALIKKISLKSAFSMLLTLLTLPGQVGQRVLAFEAE